MDITINDKLFLVFDLDDTLYPEFSFLISAYRSIASQLEPLLDQNIADAMIQQYKKGENVFSWVLSSFPILEKNEINLGYLLHHYRTHIPDICLYEDASFFLKTIADNGIRRGLITDGRGLTQRNKLKSLGLENYFNDVIISEEFGSEKPSLNNYLHFEKMFPGSRFFYFGDNTKKDFNAPLQLGWECVCMQDRGENIHNQSLANISESITILKKFNQILVS